MTTEILDEEIEEMHKEFDTFNVHERVKKAAEMF